MRRWQHVYALHPLMANEPPLDFTLAGGRDSDTQFDPLPIAEPGQASPTVSIAPSAMRPESAAVPQEDSTPAPTHHSGQDRYVEPAEPPQHSREALVSVLADAGNNLGFGETAVAVINLKTDIDRLAYFKGQLQGVRACTASVVWSPL